MSHKLVHIVLTTINLPQVLYSYLDNCSRFGHLEEVKVWLIGDRKTPVKTNDLVRQINKKGLETVYLDVEAQEAWGRRCTTFYDRLPFDNETRRNIGYLCALEDGCQTMISIDDDVYPGDADFIGGHLKTGTPWSGDLIREPSGFYNFCEHLEITPPRSVYPRGFPFLSRTNLNQPQLVTSSEQTKIGATVGLWTGAPDLDAVTWLNGKVESLGFTGQESCLLTSDTWIPVNSQNTSLTRELIPANLCVPMGWEMPGGKIERYGDIWGGYFLQALLSDTNYHLAFGEPIVEHRRNPHQPLDDLRCEYWGMMLTDWLVTILKEEFTPQNLNMIDRLEELSEFVKEKSSRSLPAWCPQPVKEFLHWTSANILAWARACQQFV